VRFVPLKRFACCLGIAFFANTACADENLFGYVKGAEPLPRHAKELYAIATQREGKGSGHYEAWDYEGEFEYGVTDRLATSIAVEAMSIDTSGIVIDGYLPKDNKYSLKFSGIDASLKYNFLSAAKDALGLSYYVGLDRKWIDPHSGQDKDEISLEQKLLLQKYFLDGQLVWVGNLDFEATRAVRHAIADLPEGFDWPTEPEMELEVGVATGLTYRFASNWFAGAEVLYVQENETEVGLERWSTQAGPSIHYGSAKWWATVTWFPQLKGGGEKYPEQRERDLHLIEKTEQEVRLKFGYNF
jgi:hypothetical protein